MVFEHPDRKVNVITAAYFLVAGVEIMAELFQYTPLIIVFKPLMPAVLMLLYLVTSRRRNILFFAAMSLSLLTNLLFIPDSREILFYGVIAFMLHRIAAIVLVVQLLKPRDYVPLGIGMIPFLLIFFYLLAITPDIPSNSFLLLIVQNILISVFGGIALANYMMHDNRRNSWLLICSLLFVALQFIVFLEKYYLNDLSPLIFRPIAMGLNAFAFYTFYEFVIATEQSDHNGAPA